MSAFDNILSPQLLDLYDDAIRGLINSLKKTCVVYLPIEVWQDCNCTDSIFNNSPNPFLKGKLTTSCSNCGGNQKIESINAVDVNLCIIYNYQAFEKLTGVTIVPKGDAQTLCELAELQIIKTSRYIIFEANQQGVKTRKFKLSGEPTPMGFRNNFYLATWEVVL